MKKIKEMYNGKKLRDVYPHATPWQVFKWKVGKFLRKVFVVTITIILIYLGYLFASELVATRYIDQAPVVQKTTDNELEKIMNEENFKKATILRARKVASDQKMKEENAKHESIINEEKTRHEAILIQIEAENEAIRAEELALVGKTNFQSPQKP